MPKKSRVRKKQTTESPDTATDATTPSPSENLEASTLVPTATKEKPLTLTQRTERLENNVERISEVLSKIIGYIEQGQGSTSRGVSPSPSPSSGTALVPAPAPGGGVNLGQMLPDIMKMASGMFSGPSAPPPNPAAEALNNAVSKMATQSVEQAFQVINQNAQIGAEVLKAIQKGTLKLQMETGGEAAAAE